MHYSPLIGLSEAGGCIRGGWQELQDGTLHHQLVMGTFTAADAAAAVARGDNQSHQDGLPQSDREKVCLLVKLRPEVCCGVCPPSVCGVC